jgi:hypothetical protein
MYKINAQAMLKDLLLVRVTGPIFKNQMGFV